MRSFVVGTSPRLEVRVGAGRVDIEPGTAGEIKLEVEGPGADQVEITQAGDLVIVRSIPGVQRWFRSVSIRALLPEASEVVVSGGSLDVNCRAPLGRVMVNTASGDLSLRSVDSLEAKTASGDISLEDCNGRLRVASASGDIRVARVGDDLSISTASGDVWVERAESGAEVTTASGTVRLDHCSGREIAVKTVSGDAHIGLRSGRRVQADISTISGSVRLPDRKTGGDNPAETCRLRVRTISGDIRVESVND